jgi:hypothetical protein
MEGLRHRGEKRTTGITSEDAAEEKESLVRTPSAEARSLAERLQEWFRGVFGRLCDVFHVPHGPELTPDELRRLSPFETYASVPFDHQNPKHEQALRDLWDALSGNAPPPHPTSLVFPQWKDYGFQQNDPGSDFRAAGVFGLHNLLFFANSYPTDFARMAPETDTGFPFAIAGLNLTMMLMAMLNISGHKTCFETTQAHNKRARKAFAELLLGTNPTAASDAEPDLRGMERTFGQVYCTAFLVLDQEWAKLRAPTMLVFNEVLGTVKRRMDDILTASKSVDDLPRLAGVPP